jgi:transcriptional regulator GlxA family with amidase domain
VAAAVGLSRAHFFALFQQHTQVTPLVYANVLRFEAALQLLSHTDSPVALVGSMVGFSTPGHFARFFRQNLGITPTGYRRAVNLFEPNAARLHATQHGSLL